jgi:lipoprotein-anchoring transpeptidase ErfK/SrfK
MRRTRRTSRWLIAATAVVFALGLSFWGIKFSRHSKPKTAAAPATQPAAAPILAATIAVPAPAPAPPTAPAGPQPLRMTTPGLLAPSTQPAPVQLALNTESPKVSAAAFANGSTSTLAPATPAATSLTPAPAPTPTAAVSAQPLVDAKAKVDANRLLDARRILNAALAAGNLSAADVAAAKQMLNTINATVVFSTRRFPDDELGGTYTVKSGDRLQKIAAENDVTWELLCRVNGLSDPKKLRAGQTIKLLKGPFCCVVNKKSFTLELYQNSPGDKGSVYITSFPVGLGKDDSTPTGSWMVEPHNKIKKPTYYSPRGEGVIAADDPANPLGGYWIGLSGIDGHAVGKTSYGIHGTIHPESVGKMESMGCIRLKNEDIAQVFEMVVEGKSVVVVKD